MPTIPSMPEPSRPPIDLESLLTDPEYAEHLRMLEALAAQYNHNNKATRFSQDLDYTHERMYRAVCDVIVGNDSYRERWSDGQGMLAVLLPTDFPPPLKPAFKAIMTTPWQSVSDVKAEEIVSKLVRLFLDLSEQVLNSATFGHEFQNAEWCVEQAQEGRPEPLRYFIAMQKKQHVPLPPVVKAFQAERVKGLVKVRRGRQSLHPARVIAIARLVQDRLSFQKLHGSSTTLDQTAIYIGSLLNKSKQSILDAYYRVYPS